MPFELSDSVLTSVRTSHDFRTVLANHKTVAILPIEVSFESPQESTEKESTEPSQRALKYGSDLQRSVYEELMRRQATGEYTVTLQEIDRTNQLLDLEEAKQQQPEGLPRLAESSLCELLQVDAVLAVELTIRGAQKLNLGRVEHGGRIVVSVYGRGNGERLWQYEQVIERKELLGSAKSIERRLLKNIASSFPYRKSLAQISL